MAKSMRINDQELSIYIEEEHPTRFEGQCMCNRNFFDSSDNVSSSETYVEDTALQGFSSEEVAMCGGEDRREEEGGEALTVNRTKVPPSKVPTVVRAGVQRKETLFFTNEGTKALKESTEAALTYQDEKVCSPSQNHSFVHAELAKLVVEIESRSSLREPTVFWASNECKRPTHVQGEPLERAQRKSLLCLMLERRKTRKRMTVAVV